MSSTMRANDSAFRALAAALDRTYAALEKRPPERLRCREDERHGVMVDTQIHDRAAEEHFGEEETDG